MVASRFVCMAVLYTTLVSGVAGCCCGKEPKRVAFDPAEQLPEWAYDAPFYYRPSSDKGDVGDVLPPAGPGCPVHCYTRDHVIHLPRPPVPAPTTGPTRSGDRPLSPADFAPRIAVYVTQTGGQIWRRAGYFGLGQTYFAFPAEDEGVYGFRFSGPGLPEPNCMPPIPAVVWHVDSTPPEVNVYVEPAQDRYVVNDQVTVRWSACDVNLADRPVRITCSWKSTEQDAEHWSILHKDLPPEGTTTLTIPPGTVGGLGIKIRAEARDRAGNIGWSFPAVLYVVDRPAEPPPAATSPPEATTLPTSMKASEPEPDRTATVSSTDEPADPQPVRDLPDEPATPAAHGINPDE